MEEKLAELEREYVKMHRNQNFIFPEFWDESDDVKNKILVLSKAIEQNKLILQVEGGLNYVEGII